MRIGVVVPMSGSEEDPRAPTWPEILAFARHAEDAGLDSAWVFDHFFYDNPSKADEPPEGVHEAWTILSAVAASTSRVELGQLVMCVSFRHPGLLAKMAATADVVSGGRVTLGLGAGWHEPEYRAFGIPFDHLGGRFEEAVQIIRSLLDGERVKFAGRYQRVGGALLAPRPDRRIPILIAGRGPRMLRLTARYADAWNTAWFGMPDDRLLSRLADLDEALRAEGRDPATLRRTVGLEVVDPEASSQRDDRSFAGPVEELARALDAHETLGIDDAIVTLSPPTERSIDRVAEAVPFDRAPDGPAPSVDCALMEFPKGSLYLGGSAPPATDPNASPLLFDARNLTTHGVIVGMTGSGKTGLAIDLLEEALLSGIPALIIDPKGDMGNLLLNFPDLRQEDFLPWVNEGDAARKGMSVQDFATKTATDWREGLASWGIEPARMRQLKDGARFTIYTPGSSAGVPLNVVGSLAAPALSWETEEETLRDEIEGFVSSVLGMAGVEADPIASREHVLLANLIEASWRQGRDLDLAGLIQQVQDPPLRKLGVFELDDFFPQKDRTALAMRLNGLVASPSFAAWLEGPPLDAPSLIESPDGRPRASIVSLAHLSDAERQFVVTLLLSRVVTWMRGLSGTTDLRVVVYMDEMFGFAPPTASPPSKKPILTLLKQARAFGVGMLLATQNPVDLDYKAMSNAGAWFIGRLQTERDKARILEGLQSASGGVDVSALDTMIGGLEQRRFVLHDTHGGEPRPFQSRWAMSYLRGPLTREQIQVLMKDAPERATTALTQGPAAAAAAGVPTTTTATPKTSPDAGAGEVPVAPSTPEGVPVYHLDPAAPWAATVGAVAGGTRLQAGVVARVHLRFDDTKAGIDHVEEWEAVWFPLPRTLDPEAAKPVDYDDRDLRPDAPPNPTYTIPDAPIDEPAFFKRGRPPSRDTSPATEASRCFAIPR